MEFIFCLLLVGADPSVTNIGNIRYPFSADSADPLKTTNERRSLGLIVSIQPLWTILFGIKQSSSNDRFFLVCANFTPSLLLSLVWGGCCMLKLSEINLLTHVAYIIRFAALYSEVLEVLCYSCFCSLIASPPIATGVSRDCSHAGVTYGWNRRDR